MALSGLASSTTSRTPLRSGRPKLKAKETRIRAKTIRRPLQASMMLTGTPLMVSRFWDRSTGMPPSSSTFCEIWAVQAWSGAAIFRRYCGGHRDQENEHRQGGEEAEQQRPCPGR